MKMGSNFLKNKRTHIHQTLLQIRSREPDKVGDLGRKLVIPPLPCFV